MSRKSDDKKKNQGQPEQEDKSLTEETSTENAQETLPVGDENQEVVEEKPVQISSKQFVKILREEFKKEQISESVYKAFLSTVPKVDWEKNYRLIWETTFRRPPAKK